MKWITYLLFRCFVLFIGVLPFFLLYKLSNFTAFILKNILNYRRDVIQTNLEKSFPKLSSKKIIELTNSYYNYLSDNILESIKSYTLSKRKILNNRFKLNNIELLETSLEDHGGAILVLSHYNNWEWGASIAKAATKQNCIVLYKPLSHKLIDRYIYNQRTKYGTKACPSQQILRVIQQEKNNKPVYLIVGDQSPSNLNKVQWINFMNQDTAFLNGSEKISKKYNYPMLFLDIRNIRRGYYEANIEELIPEPQLTKSGEITSTYAKHLENKLIENPIPWLWSHRRWKHTKNN